MKEGGMLIIQQHPESRPTDETFSSSHSGTFNVSLIRRKMQLGLVPYQAVKIGFNDSIIKANRDADVNPERLKQITYEKILESFPAIVVDCEDGYHLNIDGTHRLRWLIDNGYKHYAALIVKLSDVKDYMMRFFESFDNGKTLTELPHDEMSKIGYGEFPQHAPGYNEKFEKAKNEL